MSNWRKLSVRERYNTYRLYRDAYPEMSHRDMIKHFDGGGTIGEKEQNQFTKPIELPVNNFPYDGTSMYKGGYDLKTAREIYEPDEMGHLPTVDYRTGEWLKDKDYVTSWKELYYNQLNSDLHNEIGSPILNERGRLQYMKGYGGNE